ISGSHQRPHRLGLWRCARPGVRPRLSHVEPRRHRQLPAWPQLRAGRSRPGGGRAPAGCRPRREPAARCCADHSAGGAAGPQHGGARGCRARGSGARPATVRVGTASIRGGALDELSRDAGAARFAPGTGEPAAGDAGLPVVDGELRGAAARAGAQRRRPDRRAGLDRRAGADGDAARLVQADRRCSAMTDARLAADVESSVELLRTIAAVLDIREVFPRVSEIANKVLPHDLLTMMFKGHGGEILIEAASTDEVRGLSRFTKTDDSEPPEGFVLIDDLMTATLPVSEPPDLRERIVAAGFRSMLVVLTRAGQQSMGLGFWSKTPDAFSRDDIPVARRVADHVALAVSHE